MVRTVRRSGFPHTTKVLERMIAIESPHLARGTEPGAVNCATLATTLSGCLNHVGTLSLAGRSARELVRVLRIASWAGKSYLRLLRAESFPTPITLLDGTTHRAQAAAAAKSPTGSSPFLVWGDTWYAATACRDMDALEVLVRSQPSVGNEPGVQDFARVHDGARCAFAKGVLAARDRHRALDVHGISEILLDALRATDPGRVEASFADYAADVASREIQLMFALIDGDQPALSDALYLALQGHQRFTKTKRNSRGMRDAAAYGPLAIAAVAHDWGALVDVESDYIPRAIIEYGGMPLDQIPESS
jgi:hypothetical protein